MPGAEASQVEDRRTAKGGPSVVVSLREVHKYYSTRGPRVHALRGITLDIPPGMSILTGPSGCGKSTLINLIASFDRPSSGSIQVDGITLGELTEKELEDYRRRKVGVLFQFFHLMPMLTVLENTALPAELAGLTPQGARERARQLLERVGLSERMDHRPHQLSGGEVQRTAVARALINRPRLILADEPTGNLDSAASRRVMEILMQLTAEEGVSTLIATHDPSVVRQADLLLRMEDGQLVASDGVEPTHD